MLKTLKAGAKFVLNLVLPMLPEGARRRFKQYHELRFWRGVAMSIRDDRATVERERAHYEYYYTTFFGLSAEDYAGCALLDIGCGPCGSLEWAANARERVGLDPLADEYRKLLNDKQAMTYCTASSEDIPYPDGHFDSVSAFNCLDHVDVVENTVREMKRVTAPSGRILVIVEIGHTPTPTEPHHLDESVIGLFAPEFHPVSLRTFGEREDHNLYASLRNGVPYMKGERGILCARLERKR
jgi:SAM-dependent methyltransferase